MKSIKKTVLAFLFMAMIICCLPLGSLEAKADTLTLVQLKAKFPEGKYWNHVGLPYDNGDGYTSSPCTCHHKNICVENLSPCTCNHFQGATQCNGFARKIAYDAYGSHLSTWQTTTASTYVESLKPGDIVYYSLPHWFMVISATPNSVTIGECNWSGRCMVTWTRTIQKSTIKAYKGLKIFIAPWSLDGGSMQVDTCTCSTGYAGTYTCSTSSSPLLIRSGHGKEYGSIGSIPSGATVTVEKANGSWAHVTYNGVSGYASMDYLRAADTPQPQLDITSVRDTRYPTPIKMYTLSTAHWAANAYFSHEDLLNAPATDGHYIFGDTNGVGDYVTINAVYTDWTVYLNCPWGSSGTKDVWSYGAQFFTNMSAEPKRYVAERAANTYIRAGSSIQTGTISPGEEITLLGAYGDYTQIIHAYPGGGYCCDWVYTIDITHTHTPGPAATCTTPQVCTTCDALLAEAYGHSAGDAATHTSPQICMRCGVILVDVLEHSYSRWHETAHPHREYMACSCGDFYYLDSYYYDSSCAECTVSETPVISVSKSVWSSSETVAFGWQACAHADYYYPMVWDTVGNRVAVCWGTYETTYSVNLAPGTYDLQVASVNDSTGQTVYSGLIQITVSPLVYTLSNGEVTISGCDNSASGELVIPAEINGYLVTRIGAWAFGNCTSLASLEIPASVTNIGDMAFKVCAALENISILNPDCIISDTPDTIWSTATIHGYAGSTAEAYATKYGRTFVKITGDTLCGDADGDGEITDWDAILLNRYLAGWSNVVIDEFSSDVDGDGEITDWDAIVLERYLAGWDIVIDYN